MKLVSSLAACALSISPVLAQAPKAKAAAAAKPAESTGEPAKPAAIISSDLNGRDLYFIAHAIDIGKAINHLARETGRTQNPNLRGFGDDLVKTLAAQSAVLSTLAEMRKVRVTDEASATQKQIAEKLKPLTGVKLEKAILDTFLDLDQRLIAAYELGAKSSDATISKFAEQTLPQAREHLFYVQSMVGISPKRPPVVAEPPAPEVKPPSPAVQQPSPKPAFRTNIPLQN